MSSLLQKNRRVFVRTSKIEESWMVVEKWVWTRGHGIKVHYTDGNVWTSQYRSLKELLAGEQVREVEE